MKDLIEQVDAATPCRGFAGMPDSTISRDKVIEIATGAQAEIDRLRQLVVDLGGNPDK